MYINSQCTLYLSTSVSILVGEMFKNKTEYKYIQQLFMHKYDQKSCRPYWQLVYFNQFFYFFHRVLPYISNHICRICYSYNWRFVTVEYKCKASQSPNNLYTYYVRQLDSQGGQDECVELLTSNTDIMLSKRASE